MKRLLAAGSGPIFQLTRAFRRDERGPLHNPEFTILEWYQPGWEYPRLMDQVEELLRHLGRRHGRGELLGGGPYDRIGFGEAFQRWAGVDPHRDPTELLRRAAVRSGDPPPALDDDDRDGWLAYLQASRVEPHLGTEIPTFVDLYPADQCALARLRPGDPPMAERFELYAGGTELANGFTELVDAGEQRTRIEAENRARRDQGRAPLPVDEDFLADLARMPPSAGVAVGVDRVVMLLLAAGSIDEVMAFPGATGGAHG
jgi:elongation factor P--(R)-beta-lysine ligase